MDQNPVRKEFWHKISMQTNSLKSRSTTPVQTFTGKRLFSVLPQVRPSISVRSKQLTLPYSDHFGDIFGSVSWNYISKYSNNSIITVHGICGNGKEPWAEPESQPNSKWIERELFENTNARVIVFGYPTGPSDQDHLTISGIHQLGHQLLECLQEWRSTSEESMRPLAFVAQDIGGSIVKAALIIASQNPEKYERIIDSTFSLVFLGCPHRTDNLASLADSMAILIASASIPYMGLVKAAQSSAAMITEVNGLFLEFSILHRTKVINIFSDLPDGKSRIFPKGICEMRWNIRFQCIPLLSSHFSLLCGEAGKDCIVVLKEGGPFIEDMGPWPYAEIRRDLPGLHHLISCLPALRFNDSQTVASQHDLDLHDGLSAWIRGDGPGVLYLQVLEEQSCPLENLVSVWLAQTEAINHYTMMFTFDFGWMQRNACGLQALLTTLVVQALCFLFLNTSEAQRPETVLRILKGHLNSTSELVLLFETVNFWFLQNGWRPLWVVWNINPCLDSIEDVVGTLNGCCKYSELSPSILLAGGISETCLAVLERLNIQTLAFPKSQSLGHDAGISLDVDALKADFPMLVESENDIQRILEDFFPTRIYQVVLRSIRSLASSETAELDLTPYQPDKPELIFKRLFEAIPEDRRQQTADLLTWIACSRRTLSTSEATTTLSLESYLARDIKTPWRSYRIKRSQQSQQDLEKADEDLCGIITLEANHFAFTHPLVQQTLSIGGGRHVDSENLHLLQRLLRLLELEAGCEDSPVFLSTSSLFSLYAAQYWPDHYRIARQSELTRQMAHDHLEKFLQNDAAVQYLLAMAGYSVGRGENLATSSSRKVALLTRCGIEIDSIQHFIKDSKWTADSDLLFAAFLGAISGSFITFVQQVPVTQLNDARKIEQVLDEASVVANPEVMEALFAQIPHGMDITVPSSFLQKAMDLGLQTILDEIFNQQDWLLKMDIGLTFKKCALSGSVGIAEKLVKSEILKKPEVDKLFSQVLDESCKNRNPDIISFVFRHREGNELELWKSFETACEYGNHNAVRKILENIDGLTWDTWADNQSEALITAVSRGFEKCTGVILEFMSHTESGGEEFLRRALLEGLNKGRLGSSTQLLQTYPDILDSETITIAFRRALSQERLEIVQLLLEYGAPLNANLDGFTPLHVAASDGFIQGVEYLLSKGADIDSADFRGATPLIYACFGRHYDVAKLLLKNGADAGASMTKDPNRDWSAIEAAYRSPAIIELLINHSPQPDFRRQAILGGGHVTALYLAAANGITESVRKLVQQDVELDFERDTGSEFEKGWTALNAAAGFGHHDATRVLLEQGADVNHAEKDSEHQLHVLARIEDEKILVTLLEYNPNAWGLDQGLNSALSSGLSIGFVTRLLNAGADPNAIDTRDEYRDTPLTNACTNSTVSLDTVRLLIRRNADIQGASPNRRGSPLHSACENRGLDSVQLLLDAHADINLHVLHLGTPLQRCCCANFDPEAKIRLLVEKGADVNAEGSSCESILTLACFRASISTVSCLVEQGAQVTTPDIVGCLPIFAACLNPNSRQELVETLLSWGADLATEVRDKMGRTILHFAALGGDLSLVEWLIEKEPSLVNAKDADGWSAIHWALKPLYVRSSSSDDTDFSAAAREEAKAAIIRLLVSKGCPGINGKVRVGDDGEWSPMRIARYFNAPPAVEKLLGELSQSDDKEHRNHRKGLSLRGSCDGCYCEMYGKCFECKHPSCWDNYWLCIKCILHKEAIHPWPDHTFNRYKEDEFEPLDGESEHSSIETEKDEGERGGAGDDGGDSDGSNGSNEA